METLTVRKKTKFFSLFANFCVGRREKKKCIEEALELTECADSKVITSNNWKTGVNVVVLVNKF